MWLPVAGLSEQVSNWSVTVETDQSQDIPRGRFVFSFTPPADPDYHHVNVYRRPADSLGNPLADWLPDKVASMITGGPGGWWPLPSQPEHWLFKAVACNSLGQENPVSPPTVFMTVPTSAGVTMSKAKPSGVTGPMAVDGQGRITTAADRDVPLIASSQPGSAYLGSRIVQWMGQIWVWTGSQYQLDTNANRIKSELQQNGLTAAEFAATFAPVRVLSSVPSTARKATSSLPPAIDGCTDGTALPAAALRRPVSKDVKCCSERPASQRRGRGLLSAVHRCLNITTLIIFLTFIDLLCSDPQIYINGARCHY